MEANVVEVVENLNGNRTLRVRCPHCPRVHLHGAGNVNEPLEKYLTFRGAHCGPYSYLLVKNG